MKKTILPLLLIALALSMFSCKVMYVPNAQNVPLMKEKNDLKASVGLEDVQVAYAVTDNIGVMANGFYKKSDWTITSGTRNNKYFSSRTLFEGGVGYFKPLSGNTVFETYAGGGMGHVQYNYDLMDDGALQEANEFGVNMVRFFIQPAIGVQKETFGFAFSSRFAGVSFAEPDTLNYTPAQLAEEDIDNLSGDLYMFIEPCLTIRAGIPYAQFQAQLYYNYKITGNTLNHRRLGLNLGVFINVDSFYKDAEQN